MYQRLNQHLQNSNILVTEEFGFRKGLSTDNAAYKLTDSILSAQNKQYCIIGVFCDLAKSIMSFCCKNYDFMV
jgi:hypothetical protein